MRVLTDREERLASELQRLPDGAMLLETLDGFFAGLVLCPVKVSITEWLPYVFDARPEPEPIDDVEAPVSLLDDLLWYYERVGRMLTRHPTRYVPYHARFENEEGREDELIWEVWAEGFGLAVHLRPDAWEIYRLEPEAEKAFLGLTSLVGIAAARHGGGTDDSPSTITGVDGEVDAIAERMSEEWVRVLASHAAPAAPTRAPGRNDPCPCGSGRKYKKCCGTA